MAKCKPLLNYVRATAQSLTQIKHERRACRSKKAASICIPVMRYWAIGLTARGLPKGQISINPCAVQII